MLGQAKATSHSQIALEVVGIDCQPEPSASEVLSGSVDDILSVYPTERLLSAEDAQASEIAPSQVEDAVTFGLDDVVLEDDVRGKGLVIPAGGELYLGYRLNLAEAGARLDFSKLPQVAGGVLPLASIAYTFAVAG